jgi:hypothetical protein
MDSLRKPNRVVNPLKAPFFLVLDYPHLTTEPTEIREESKQALSLGLQRSRLFLIDSLAAPVIIRVWVFIQTQQVQTISRHPFPLSRALRRGVAT